MREEGITMEKKRGLLSEYPDIASEWHPTKNGSLTAADVTPMSGRKVWWLGKCGHEWQSTISHRTRGNGCPYCSGKKVLAGYNDLLTVNPTLASEWNYERNGDLMPENLTANNRKKVWWKCSKGHEWQAKIYHRNNGSGCPVCKSERNTSFPEFAIEYYLTKCGLEVIHSFKEYGYELDVFIPILKTAVEFDGYFWHKDKVQTDLEKNLLCKKDGIILYRIREGLSSLNDSSIDYEISKDHKDISQVIGRVVSEIVGKYVDVDLKRDAIAIENMREYIEKKNSVLSLNPIIASEWNYERNGRLRPEFYASNSCKKVWWKCGKGHEWQARIENRNRGIGCPYCSGRLAIKGETDLQTVNPDLAKEWNFEKNGDLTPADVLPNSEKKVWWKCQKGHEWQAIIGNRSKGQGCPYCSGRRVLKGFNDLQTKNPLLSSEWNYAKNNGLRPEDVTPNSNKKVWWKCSKGHEWQAKVCDRNKGNGCPYCGGKRVSIGFNDLQTVNPKLASEWNYEKNAGLTPKDVTPSCNKKVWWKCSKGHEWEAFIYNRNKGNNCPYCANTRKDTRSTKLDQ